MKKRLSLFLLLFLLCLTFPALADLEVHFLNVGPGSCTILTCDGESMIVNGGPADKSDVIFTALRDIGIDDLKYVFATSTDEGQTGGLPAALHAATVHSIYAPSHNRDAERFSVLCETAAEKGISVSVPMDGEVFHLGRSKLTISADAEAVAIRVQYGVSTLIICSGDHITADSTADVSVIQITGSLPDVLEDRHQGFVILNQEHDKDLSEAYLKKGVTPIWTTISGRTTFTSDGLVDYVSAENQYVANKNTRVAHRANCSYVSLIKPMHYQALFTVEQAESLEYKPCKHCTPWEQ